MDKCLENIVKRLMEDAPLELGEVREALRRYPYFTLPAAVFLRQNPGAPDDEARRELMQAVALASPSPETLYMLIEQDGDGHADFYPEEKRPQVTTESAIDTFLQTYGSTSPEEEELLNRLIFNPVPDYGQLLAREEEKSVPAEGEAPAGSDDDRLNRFILSRKKSAGAIPDDTCSPVAVQAPDRRAPEPPSPAPDNSLLSESLAKIFIRQHHYGRAYEIISQLSLNYPEKSVYFADQLRFLRKLMLIQEQKEQSK